jgi:hypothetical protein
MNLQDKLFAERVGIHAALERCHFTAFTEKPSWTEHQLRAMAMSARKIRK